MNGVSMQFNLMTIIILSGLLAFVAIARADLDDIETELVSTPLDEKFGFSEPVPWTGWNKVFLVAGMAGQIYDVVSTVDTVDGDTCIEKNVIVGEDPSTQSLIVIKVVGISALYALVEYGVPTEYVQTVRNWLYGTLAIMGFGAGIHNYNECD
jgi:hypothetical protein